MLSVTSARGVRAGYAGACGVFLGDTILLILTACGAARLLHTDPALFLVIKRARLISLLNSKAILFLLSFFIQFIDPAYRQPAIRFLILSTIVMLFSAL